MIEITEKHLWQLLRMEAIAIKDQNTNQMVKVQLADIGHARIEKLVEDRRHEIGRDEDIHSHLDVPLRNVESLH